MQQDSAHSDEAGPDAGGLRFLVQQAGAGKIVVLGLLLLLTSLTEGFGLLLLVPITQALAGQLPDSVPLDWLPFAQALTPAALLLIAVGLVCLRAVIVYITNERRRRLGLSLTNRLRAQSHAALLEADWRWLSKQNSADHAALIMGETVRAGNLVDHALSLATSVVTLLAMIAAAALIAPQLTLIIIAAGIILGLPLLVLRRKTAARAQDYSSVYADLQGLVSNGLDHLRAARIASAADRLADDFRQASDLLEQHERVYFRDSYRAQAIFQIAVAVALALAIYLGIIVAGISIVIFVPLLAIAARSSSMLIRIQQALHSWRYNLPALEQLLELIAQARANRETQEVSPTSIAFKDAIELRDIHFAYGEGERDILAGFNGTLAAGSLVAIRGASGAGKSTFADLLSGLLKPDRGKVMVDGAVMTDAQRMRWRSQIAYVEQAAYFFDGSIADNLRWGMEVADDAAMIAALKLASATFVLDMPDGLSTRMGEGGRLFSGGELQRIALARALIRQPDLLILDEVSAGLDAPNKAFVRQSVANLKGAHTIVLLSHDQDMIDIADSVLDLDAP